MTSMLTQELRGKQRPVGYYSGKQAHMALCFGPCLKAMQRERWCQSNDGSKVVMKFPHSVHTLFTMRRYSVVKGQAS